MHRDAGGNNAVHDPVAQVCDVQLAVDVLTEGADAETRGEQHHPGPGAALNRAPDRAAAEVGEEIDTLERQDLAAAVAIPPRDRASLGVRVIQNRRDEGPRAGRTRV